MYTTKPFGNLQIPLMAKSLIKKGNVQIAEDHPTDGVSSWLQEMTRVTKEVGRREEWGGGEGEGGGGQLPHLKDL